LPQRAAMVLAASVLDVNAAVEVLHLDRRCGGLP
jgi:hypothetical protein